MTVGMIALYATLAVIAGVALSHVAARRAGRQPLLIDTKAEMTVVGSVLAEPALYRELVALKPADFSITDLGEIWAKFDELAEAATDPIHLDEARRHNLPARVLNRTSEELCAEIERQLTLEDVSVEELLASKAADREKLTDAGEIIVASGLDRLYGSGQIVPADNPTFEQPLQRVPSVVSKARMVLSALVAAAAAAAGLWLLDGRPLAQASYMVLCAGLLVLSLVDIDTLYIDIPAFAATLIVSGTLAVWDAQRSGNLTSALLGLAGTAAMFITLEIAARIYLRLRGRHGMGGGDLLLLALVVGLPMTLSDSWRVGAWGFIAAGLLFIVSRVIAISKGRSSKDDPHPFGPYLASGWLVVWSLVTWLG